jgi:hypothetical protein
MKITREWAMPSRHTFTIKPIKKILEYYGVGQGWIDPFAGEYSMAELTNDLNPRKPTKYHKDAKQFLDELNGKYDGGLYDPPYSLRQIMECYDGFGATVNKKWATTKFYSDTKTSLANKIKKGGFCISFGWNSVGMGKKRGFEIIEILLISHGRLHNDTIVTVERKIL